MKSNSQILLFYKYVFVDDPQKLFEDQRVLCEKLNLKGRIIVAKEGINATVEGTKTNTEKYIKSFTKDERFKDVHFKKSVGDGNAFPKLSIKLRDEIVSAHLKDGDINPTEITGKYLTPSQLHNWIETKRKFYIVDMRNDYETEVGFFKDSVLPQFTNFRDLPKVLPIISDFKDQPIVTVCTGGVRCEKASGFLVKNGFLDVYQLEGGIVSYMEKYPNQNFLGKLYVFDGRVTMGFNTDSKEHVVVGKCTVCQKSADTYYDCANLYCQGKRHFISCQSCIERSKGYCKVCDVVENSKLQVLAA